MIPRTAFVAIALAALSCQERPVSPSCSPDPPVMMAEHHRVRYRVHLQDALRCSRETGRPVLLVFQSWASASTSAGWDVLTDNEVEALIQDRLILCVLLVDDRAELTPEDLIDFPQLDQDKLITTIGRRNSMLESQYFEKTSQPLFTLVNADFAPLAEPMGYVPKNSPDLLVNWIQTSLKHRH